MQSKTRTRALPALWGAVAAGLSLSVLSSVGASACKGVEPLEQKPVVIALVNQSPKETIEVSAGDEFELALQVVADNGSGTDDVSVYFVRDDESKLNFITDKELVNNALHVQTTEKTFKNIKANGVAIAKISVPAPASAGTTAVWGSVSTGSAGHPALGLRRGLPERLS